jgi:hypothetical protein
MSKVSSAYYIIGKSAVYPASIDNLRSPISLALLIMDCNKSAARTNMFV